MEWWESEASGGKRPVESSNGYGEKCVWLLGGRKEQSEENNAKRTSFPMSDQSVMCEIKRHPMPQGEEEDGASASRWQATVEVKLEVEAVQSA